VDIDVKPGNKSNVINPNQESKTWAVILGNADFDVTLVDPTTMRLGPDEASPDRFRFKDVDCNGYFDLMGRFKIPQTGISCGDTEVQLTAETFDGQALVGSDSITAVGCQ